MTRVKKGTVNKNGRTYYYGQYILTKPFEDIMDMCYIAVPSTKPNNNNKDERIYINGLSSNYIRKRIYDMWGYEHKRALRMAVGKDGKHKAYGILSRLLCRKHKTDWKDVMTTLLNAEYAGNATYEWFDLVNAAESSDGDEYRHMKRVNQFDLIVDYDDDARTNCLLPLEYMFEHPDMTLASIRKNLKDKAKRTGTKTWGVRKVVVYDGE